ncbi:protein phosphatase Slingshot isoform X3 [Aethina tumida]|uniref:protein phosphatase Slingshot isoform X3 n=1 Tax=Aethina tumida TaxID=116153 RepID=UPI00096B628D|nr:protein phosphatase Slingshot isoform X3 [Aethina tumida]
MYTALTVPCYISVCSEFAVTVDSLSECYFAGKGTALVLPDASEAQKAPNGVNINGSRFGQTNSTTGTSSNIQKHLQSMFYLLEPQETLKMAVKLESVHPSRTRYLVVVSRSESRGEESCLLGIDCNEKTTVGLVLRVLANTRITLDGDGGFSVTVGDRHHIFKPVSVQAMWSALQTLHKVSAKAREQNYFQGGMTHGWADYYERRIESDRSCLNEWHAMDNLESKRPPSPDSIRTKPTAREETESYIRTTLKEIMMSVDLDEVTSKVIRTRLEEELDMDLGEYKSFIDQEMLVILGQMDAPTEIFDHVYLGSEWNASNYEELQKNGVGHILNVTREIDNFFPGTFDYLNVRVYDDEKTDLLKHWDDTYKYITKAKENGSKVLVHCKMGVSRSASVVIAYAMKAYNWDFGKAFEHVKEKRTCIKPNSSFLIQLETYQGMLDAMKNKEKLLRSKSETNLKSPAVCTKTDKISPQAVLGTEPTVSVEALSKSFNMQTTGEDLKQFGERPKSWSPDNLATDELLRGTKSSPVFLSLENLSQKSSSKESVKSQQTDGKVSNGAFPRHVLMPCDNGESYSVSPNQIVHLPGHHDQSQMTASVRERVHAMDKRSDVKKKLILNLSKNGNQQTDTNGCNEPNVQLKGVSAIKETWDPGEGCTPLPEDNKSPSDSTSDACDSVCESSQNGTTLWTSAVTLSDSSSINKVPEQQTVIRHKAAGLRRDGDVFSNQVDRAFEREEKRQQRMSMSVLPSSVPELSAAGVRECPSRQNSWGSYDSAVVLSYQSENSDVLSRQSSWGSGDTRTHLSRNSSWGSYDMRNRTHHVNDRDKERAPAEAINPVFVSNTCEDRTVSSAISDKIDIPSGSDEHNKQQLQHTDNSRLSISAPEPSSMELVSQECSLSRSASNVSGMGKMSRDASSSVVSTAQCSSVRQHRTFLENLHKDAKIQTRKSDDLLENSSGKVRNLKKEFEAKSSTNIDVNSVGNADTTTVISDSVKTKNRVNSLPTSPVIQTKDAKERSDEDLNFKHLIGYFENKEEPTVNLRQKGKVFGSQNRNARYSCTDIGGERSAQSKTPLISNLNKAINDGEYKRPPIPAVRNASPKYVVAATVIASAAAKKQQQYGKSHPLARLSIKPRHNNPVYNTM